MLLHFIENFLLGFVITALPGAVLFETIRRTLSRRGAVTGFLVGNFTGMLFVILLAFFGLAALLSNHSTSAIFYVLSGGMLVVIGLVSIFSQPHDEAKHSKSPGTHTAFASGFVLSAANPASIAFWVVMTGKLLQENSVFAALVNCVSIVIGALTFFAILILLVTKIKAKIHEHYLLWTSRIFGAIVFVYGLSILGNLLR